MTDQPAHRGAPHAVTRRSRRISIIWIVPIVAVAIGAWLAWDTLSKEGPTIKVTFDSAEGLQAGQSQLKYKDIVFGTVKSLELTPDRFHVVVTIATTHEAVPLLTDGAVFWVVKPRLFAGNLSGLDTILSGSYVGMIPGPPKSKAKTVFQGQEDPPVLEEHIPGRSFLLKARRIGSISVGSPIFLHDINVGQVLGWEAGDMADAVTIHAFVRAPYDAYVTDETRFWNASGISISLGSKGIDVKMESLRALLFGGIAFTTPLEHRGEQPAAENHVFPLFANQDEADSASYTRVVSAVSYFTGTVSGLGSGSDVTIHGLKVGRVTDVRLKVDPAKAAAIVVEVHYEVQPERITGIGQRILKTDTEAVALMLKLGLRASLQNANLITGQQVVALGLNPDAPQVPVTMEDKDFVIPTTESAGFASLASSATDVLNKVNAIPFAEIGTNLNSILGSVNKATEGPELREAVNNLAATLAATHDFVRKIDSGASPAVKKLPEIANSLQAALANVNKLTVSVNDGYGGDTKFHRDLDRLLVQTNEAVRSIQALADVLSRHPEALIKGRPE